MEENQETVRGTVSPTTGCCESFNSRLCDELPEGEIFCSLAEARSVIESWRRHHDTERPAFLSGLPATSPAGPAVAGFATRNRFAGYLKQSTETRHALRWEMDLPIGEGHDPAGLSRSTVAAKTRSRDCAVLARKEPNGHVSKKRLAGAF